MFVCDNSLSADELKTFAAQISANEKTVGTLFSCQNDVVSYALCRSKDAAVDLKALSKHLNQSLNGKGGGSNELCCGRLPACEEEKIRSVLHAF